MENQSNNNAPVLETTNTTETPEITNESSNEEALDNSSVSESNSGDEITELKDQLESDKSLSKEEKKEIKKQIKELKLKVDGKEFTETLPFELPDDPKIIEYMTKQLQMAKMGNKRASEYATLEKDVKSFFDYLKEDPQGALSDPKIGIDIKKLAAKIIESEIENSKKSPEQLEREKLETELKKIKAERENEKKDLQEREFQRLQEQEYERYDVLIDKAITAHGLPKSPYVIKKTADYMLMGLQQGIDVTPDDVMALVKEEMHNDIKDLLANMGEDGVEALIGKDMISKLRKKNVVKAKAQIASKKALDVGASSKDAAKPVQKQSFKSFFGV